MAPDVLFVGDGFTMSVKMSWEGVCKQECNDCIVVRRSKVQFAVKCSRRVCR